MSERSLDFWEAWENLCPCMNDVERTAGDLARVGLDAVAGRLRAVVAEMRDHHNAVMEAMNRQTDERIQQLQSQSGELVSACFKMVRQKGAALHADSLSTGAEGGES